MKGEEEDLYLVTSVRVSFLSLKVEKVFKVCGKCMICCKWGIIDHYIVCNLKTLFGFLFTKINTFWSEYLQMILTVVAIEQIIWIYLQNGYSVSSRKKKSNISFHPCIHIYVLFSSYNMKVNCIKLVYLVILYNTIDVRRIEFINYFVFFFYSVNFRFWIVQLDCVIH